MHPAKVDRSRLHALTDLPNVGPATAGDLRLLGLHAPADLAGRDPLDLFDRLCHATGIRHDPCVIDVLASVTRFVDGEPPRAWWDHTPWRKATLAGRVRALRPAGTDDAARPAAEALSLGNMRAYLAARGIAWEPARFADSWRRYENHAIHVDGHAAGLLRLLPEDGGAALGLRDLQLRPSFQRQGHGAWAVGEALRLAAARGMARVQLRVYAENPARALYARLGFAETGYDPATRTAHMCRATA